MKRVLLIFYILVFFSCSSGRESIMPFRNLAYSGERLFPIQNNNSQTVIRIWVNNGTSIDRIITVSQDSTLNSQSKLVEIGSLLKGKKHRKIFREHDQRPKSGIPNFLSKVDSLNLYSYDDQKEFQTILHEPFSQYIVEYRNGNKYKLFKFNTNFPNPNEAESKYTRFEKLLFDEFNWKFNTN